MDIPVANQIQTGARRVEMINHNPKPPIENTPPIPMESVPMDCYPELCNSPHQPPQQNYIEPIMQPIPQPQVQKSTYHIMDLFWLINDKYKNPETMSDGESQFITISYNMDFGNLRVAMYKIPEEAIHQNVIFQQSLTRLIAGTIYPSSCLKYGNCGFSHEPIVCIEQLINNTGEQWQRERPITYMYKQEQMTKLVIMDPVKQEKFFFDFKDWQLEAFNNACQFVYTQGFQLHGQNIIRNR